MKNMAGSTPQMSAYVLSKELQEAGVPIIQTPIHGEPNSPVAGLYARIEQLEQELAEAKDEIELLKKGITNERFNNVLLKALDAMSAFTNKS